MNAMYAYLEKHDPEKNQHRFYVLSVQLTVFENWTLVREWGRIGSGGRVEVGFYDELESAQLAFTRKKQEKLRRDYRRT